MEAKDYLGNALNLGDTVVYVELGYRNFSKAVVSKITKCKVKLIDGKREVYQDHSQVLKVG